jgi:hypothetical protein
MVIITVNIRILFTKDSIRMSEYSLVTLSYLQARQSYKIDIFSFIVIHF